MTTEKLRSLLQTKAREWWIIEYLNSGKLLCFNIEPILGSIKVTESAHLEKLALALEVACEVIKQHLNYVFTATIHVSTTSAQTTPMSDLMQTGTFDWTKGPGPSVIC